LAPVVDASREARYKRGVRFLAVVLLAASACTTPCEDLRAHAEECGAARGRWVDGEDSVCTTARQESGDAFDSFAECVTASSCDDAGAVERCEAEHLPATGSNACMDYRVWSAACGLEPTGTEDDCNGVAESAGGPAFGDWVACVTAGGCPVADDPRWEVCRDAYLPQQATLLLDACVIVSAWTRECAGQSRIIPVEEISVPMCLAQADPFTAESYWEYATCLQGIDCETVSARLDCLLRLEVQNRDRLDEQCEELIAFTDTCESLVAGGTVEVCIRTFGRFTAESIDAYSACLTAGECGDPELALSCGSLLELQ
jgi:hypothetical protein